MHKTKSKLIAVEILGYNINLLDKDYTYSTKPVQTVPQDVYELFIGQVTVGTVLCCTK